MSEKKYPFCGASTDLKTTECKFCGEPIAVQSPQYQVQQTKSGNAYSENDYAYLKPYYQEEFKKISLSNETYKGEWNWCAFFISWIWAFTKGLWGLGLVGIGISILVSVISSDLLWLNLFISILFGARGNFFYYNLVKNKKQFPNRFSII